MRYKNIFTSIILLIYTLNLIYFSLTAIMARLDTNESNSKFNSFLSSYSKMINENSFSSNIFSILKLNAGYGFFGKGLMGPTRIVFESFNEKDKSLKKVEISEAFATSNGKLRSITLGSRANSALMKNIKENKKALLNLNLQNYQRDNLEKRIIVDENLLDLFLKKVGLKVLEDQNELKYFTAKIYFIKPNTLNSIYYEQNPKERIAYLQWEILYDQTTNEIKRMEIN